MWPFKASKKGSRSEKGSRSSVEVILELVERKRRAGRPQLGARAFDFCQFFTKLLRCRGDADAAFDTLIENRGLIEDEFDNLMIYIADTEDTFDLMKGGKDPLFEELRRLLRTFRDHADEIEAEHERHKKCEGR